MRIGYDASPIIGDRGGVGWHTYYLLQAFTQLKDDVELICYTKPGALGRIPAEPWMRDPRLRWVEAGRLLMRRRGERDGLDLYHGTNFKLQTMGRHGGVVTVYDLWMDRYPQYSRKVFGQRLSFYRTKRTARRARRVITISEHSARDIETLYGLSRDRIAVIPCGVSEEFKPSPDEAAFHEVRTRLSLPTERFILFVGGSDPRKNHRVLVEAYARHADRLTDYTLVLIGDPVHRFGSFAASVQAHGVAGRVIWPGRLPIQEIRLLYSHADLFVFPSIYEGFGMPVLEAMACGAPVITANTTSLPEVAGDAAILVNPTDPEELGAAIIRVLSDQGLQERLRTRGFARAKSFTWDQTARQTLAVYRTLCGEGV